MEIIFVGPFGLQPKGTMSVRALPLAKQLVSRGHQVTMLLPPWDDPERAGQSWEEQGVRIVNVALPPAIPGLFHLLLTRALVARALARQPHVIHFFKPKAYSGLAHLVLWWLRRLAGRPFRLVVDADDWEQAWNERLPYSRLHQKFFAWQEQWGLRNADLVTVASRTLERLVTAERWPDSDNIVYVPNGYLPERVEIEPDPTTLSPAQIRGRWQLGSAPTILLYSRFAEFRLVRIVRLVRQVAAQLPTARWLFVGQGLQGEEQQLADQLAQAGLDKYVHFAGWVPAEDLPAYFEVADLAVFPYDDTLINRTKCSVKLIDLLSVGLPVVADAVGQTNEYIQPNISGLLVPAEDEEKFAKAVIELLQDPAKRQQLGQAAADYVRENFDWARLARNVEKGYVDAV